MSAKRGPLATEDQEQRALIDWWALACRTYKLPEFALYAVPNGGWRHPATAARLKGQGVRAGVPDLFLAVPRGTFHGLYIEMKRTDGKPTAYQLAFIAYALATGYDARVCHGFETAQVAIAAYLKHKPLTR